MVVRDEFRILHWAFIVYPIRGEPIVVAQCRWWAYGTGLDLTEWNMNDASKGETNCMACIATEDK